MMKVKLFPQLQGKHDHYEENTHYFSEMQQNHYIVSSDTYFPLYDQVKR